MTSKNAPSCQSITLSEFTLIPKTGLSRLIKGSAVDYFRHIKEDIELEAYATYCLEFVDKYTKENGLHLVNLGDTKKIKLLNDWLDIATKVGFTLEEIETLSTRKRFSNKNSNKLLVMRKS